MRGDKPPRVRIEEHKAELVDQVPKRVRDPLKLRVRNTDQ